MKKHPLLNPGTYILNPHGGNTWQRTRVESDILWLTSSSYGVAQLEGITVAEVLPALSSREVLTTDWVSGAPSLCLSSPSMRVIHACLHATLCGQLRLGTLVCTYHSSGVQAYPQQPHLL